MAGTEYFGADSSTTRPHTWVLPVNTMWKSHNHTLSRHWYDYPQPRIIFSRSTQEKYQNKKKKTRKNSVYWQINTSWLFSYTRLIQVSGCTVTRSAGQHRPCFHTSSNSRYWVARPIRIEYFKHVTEFDQSASRIWTTNMVRVYDKDTPPKTISL